MITVEVERLQDGRCRAVAYDWGKVEVFGDSEMDVAQKFIDTWNAREWPVEHVAMGRPWQDMPREGETAAWHVTGLVEGIQGTGTTEQEARDDFVRAFNRYVWPEAEFRFQVDASILLRGQ